MKTVRLRRRRCVRFIIEQGVPMALDILIKNVAVWGSDGPRDLGIAGGRFVTLRRGAAETASLVLDADGRMAVPGFVEPHIHLDKAFIRAECRVNQSGTLMEAIEIIWDKKRRYTVDEVAARASRVIESAASHGVTRMRTHVDVDPIGLRKSHGAGKVDFGDVDRREFFLATSHQFFPACYISHGRILG